MKKIIIFISVAIFFNFKIIAQNTQLIAPDTVAFNDTAWFEVDYQGSIADPVFNWMITDSITGYDSVIVNGLLQPGYKITRSNKFFYVFEKGGSYDIIVDLPETLLRKRIIVWEPRRSCNLKVKECEGSIVNGGFEGYYLLPFCNAQINHVCEWHNAQVIQNGSLTEHDNTPDYYHRNFQTGAGGSDCFSCDIPTGYLINQDTREPGTNAFAGIYTWLKTGSVSIPGGASYPDASLSAYREYIQQYLQKPLIPGRTYTLEFYLSLADVSNFTTDIHVGFTTQPPVYNPVYLVTPFGLGNLYQNQTQLTAPTSSQGQLISVDPIANGVDYYSWKKISVTFTYSSLSPANYITIGNWRNDLNCNSQFIEPQAMPFPNEQYYGFLEACYYLIDDVQVTEQDNQCCGYDVYIDGRYSLQYISDYTILPGDKVLIEGTVSINQNFTFDNNKVFMGPNARIDVALGKQLTIQNNSHLRACSVMWDGIFTFGSTTKINVYNSKIEDAIKGIETSLGTEVNVNGSTMRNNRMSLHYTSGSGNWNTNVARSTFTSNNLLPPYWNQKSYVHILCENAGSISFSPVGSPNYNRFLNANFGIISKFTDLTVENSLFRNIKDYGVGWSLAILNENLFGGLKTSTIGNISNSLQGNTFSDCDNGILQSGSVSYWIHNNKFNKIKYRAIWGNNNTAGIIPLNINIQRNDIKDVMRGVDLVDFKTSNVIVANNTLKNNIGSGNTFGIRLRNTVLNNFVRCPNCFEGFNVRVDGNSIDKFGRGIRSEQVKCLLIQNNDIKVKVENGDLYTGISNVMSPFVHVVSNVVDGNVSDYRSTGIRQTECKFAITRCNEVKKQGQAFMFDGATQNSSYTYLNDIRNSETGFYLNSALIGPQIEPGFAAQNNEWFGSITRHFYAYNIDGAQSPFVFQTGTFGSSLWPSPLISSANLGATPVPFISPPTGPTWPVWNYCPMPTCNIATRGEDSVYMYQTIQRLIIDTNSTPMYPVETNYLQGFSTYGVIMDNPWLQQSSPEIYDFYVNHPVNYNYFYNTLKFIEEENYGKGFEELDKIYELNAVDSVFYTAITSQLKLLMSQNGKFHINDLLKSSDIVKLTENAQNCLYQYNQGTWWSRSILNTLLDVEIDHSCEYSIAANKTEANPPDLQPSIIVYPNPTTNYLNIDMLNFAEGEYRFSIFDLSGKILLNTIVWNGSQQINLPDLSDGLYIYVVQLNNQTIGSGKVIITH